MGQDWGTWGYIVWSSTIYKLYPGDMEWGSVRDIIANTIHDIIFAMSNYSMLIWPLSR